MISTCPARPSCGETTLSEPCIARQPIMDSRKILQAHELVFSSRPESIFNGDVDDEGLDQALQSSLLGSTRESLTEGLPFFIRVSSEVVLSQRYRELPPHEAILILAAGMTAGSELVEELSEAKALGYTLAIEDFVGQRHCGQLMALADIVRIDHREADDALKEECALLCEELGVRSLAAELETREDFERAHDLGYRMFQGYFLLRPELVERSAVPGFKAHYMRFFEQVNSKEISFDEVERIIKGEVSLSLRLLRYLNTASFNWRKEVSSIRQALILLGERQLRRWASLLAVTGLGEDQPPEAARACLVRARFCELMAEPLGLEGRELDLFFCGLLSGVDALVGRPMAEVLEDLSVSPEIQDALLGQASELGTVLQLVLAHEAGNWEHVATVAETAGPDSSWINPAYVEAASWADDVMDS